jgi:hypothetical protein
MGSHGPPDNCGQIRTRLVSEPIIRAYGYTPTDARGHPGRLRSELGRLPGHTCTPMDRLKNTLFDSLLRRASAMRVSLHCIPCRHCRAQDPHTPARVGHLWSPGRRYLWALPRPGVPVRMRIRLCIAFGLSATTGDPTIRAICPQDQIELLHMGAFERGPKRLPGCKAFFAYENALEPANAFSILLGRRIGEPTLRIRLLVTPRRQTRDVSESTSDTAGRNTSQLLNAQINSYCAPARICTLQVEQCCDFTTALRSCQKVKWRVLKC